MCRSCGSNNQRQFGSEIYVHLPGLDKPTVMVFPTLVVCLECGGVAEFTIPEDELRLLVKEGAAAA